MKTQLSTRLKNTILFLHRWLGVFFCALFLTWFLSGVVMMYCDYPAVSTADRLARETALDPFQIRLMPQEAYARLKTDEPPGSVRLASIDGRPAYRFRKARTESIVFADTGETVTTCPPEISLRLASAWTRQPAAIAMLQTNTEADQWTVSGQLRSLLPLRKYAWPDGEEVYVSTVSCDVVQYTTRSSRLGAYLGAIPHWLYFTPLRKHAAQWSRLVVWASGLATVAGFLGLLVGLWMYSPSKAYRRKELPSSIPYTGPKRWHMVLGLGFGSIACTWAFSGLLSMDPVPALQNGNSDVSGFELSQALRTDPSSLAAFAPRSPQQVVLSLPPDFRPKELELASAMGQPVYFATMAQGQALIIPVLSGRAVPEFDHQSIVSALEAAAQRYRITETRVVTQYESYYLDRHHALPLPVIFVQFNDAERSMYYVDPKTARIVLGYNSHTRSNRWLYHGLHSFDFPWLYRRRPAWDFVMLGLLAGGISLCITALILAWRVVRRSIREAIR